MITGMPRVAIAVKDFPNVIATFKDKLGMPVIDMSESSVGSLGAKLAMCVPDGGCNIEIMSPANPDTPLSQSVQRFIDRKGEGHFALMLEAADPDIEAEGLLSRGLKVLPRMEGAGGRDVHPNSTNGVLIRVYPIDSFVGEKPEYYDEASGVGLSGIKRVLIAVKDLGQAIEVYGTRFAMEIEGPVPDHDRGVVSAKCTPPGGRGEIELVAVDNIEKPFASSVDAFLKDSGEGMFALVLQTQNLQKTKNEIEAKGLELNNVVGLNDVLELDAGSMFGTRFWIE